MARKDTSFPREKVTVLLLEGINDSAIGEFRSAGYHSVEVLSTALDEKELIKKIKGVHILGIRSKTKVTKNVLDAADKLLAIGCYCIGTNQVDLEAATSAGVAVFNSPFSNTRSVAELVISHCISLMRRIPEKSQAAHAGAWMKDHRGCYEVRGKTLGIIGYGHIGSQVSVLAENMGMNVIFYDVESKLTLGNANPIKSLETLLKQSDIVSLHVPGTESTRNLMNSKRISQMKTGAVLINLSRGDVLDNDALAEAIKKGKISGAAVDVFPNEPASRNANFNNPLQGLANIILTPHIGGSTEEAQISIGIDAARKSIGFIETGSCSGSHSIPDLSLPIQSDAHRLLHIHKNQPGVLGEINSILSAMKVNILGQYLKTNEHIGYVVLDIDKKTSGKALEALRKVKHTIRVRSLY